MPGGCCRTSSRPADGLSLLPAVAPGWHVGTREHRPARAAPHQHRTQRPSDAQALSTASPYARLGSAASAATMEPSASMAANATSWSIVAALCCAPECTPPISRTAPVFALLARGADEQFPRVEHLWVDQGYIGTAELDRGASRLARGGGSASSASARRMGPTWQPTDWRTVWFSVSATTRSESLPWCSSAAVGRGADLCLALSEPSF